MRKTPKCSGEKVLKDSRSTTRKHYSSEEKIKIVSSDLRGEGKTTLALASIIKNLYLVSVTN